MRTKFLLLTTFFYISSALALTGPDAKANKEIEIKHLEDTLTRVYMLIRATSEIRAKDYLALLPGVSISRSAPYGEVKNKETYLSLSLNMNQAFTVANKQTEREVGKRKAARQVQSLGYRIKKLIKRKHAIADQIWRYKQIKKSADSPVDIAKYDDKINNLEITIEDVEMDIEEAYAEIDFICAELGR